MKSSNLEVRSASAGTGKTTSLVLEYLQALRFTPARRIAAVTFTRVGAIDLRERLRAGLREVVAHGSYLDFKPANLELYRSALRELGSASITTIHGFFRELLRLNAPALGLDPEFSNLDEGEALETFRDAASSVLAQAALRDAPGGELLAKLGWERSLQALEALHHKRVYAPFRAGNPEDGSEPDGLTVSLLAAFETSLNLYLSRLAARALAPTDVELQTLKLLSDPAILERVRSRVSVLLVDEFQDVNPLQAKIFQGLNLERVLLVGDPKQSIYAFRDADVNAFLDVYQRAKTLAPLTTTYRHGAALSAFYSSLAAQLFPEFSEIGLPSHVSPGRIKPGDGIEPRAELHVFEAPSLEAGRHAEAAFLARRLRELNADGTPWHDMAVLVRSRTALPPLEGAFALEGIPVLMVAGQKYYDRREIRDAITLLRSRLIAPEAPQFAHTLAALSRIPGIDLPLNALEEILRDHGDVRLGLRRSTAPEASRLRELLEIVRDAKDAVTLLEDAWVFLGYGVLAINRQATANLDGLLYQLAARGLRDPRAALSFLERARLSEAESDEPLEAGDAVRLLTVHSSKGLEFPVTAVFDLARGENPGRPDLVVHPDGEVALKPGARAKKGLIVSRYASIFEHLKRRSEGESHRLLYVALTRAKDRLIMTGSSTGKPRAWLETMLTKLQLFEKPDAMPGLKVERHKVVNLEQTQAPPPPPLEPRFTPDLALAKARFARPLRRVRAPSKAPEADGTPFDPELADVDNLETEIPDEIPSTALETEFMGIPNSDRVIGTLTHYAIAENLLPDNQQHRQVLAAQYLLHPYSDFERQEMLERAWWLVDRYAALYPDRHDRLQDFAELPFAFARNGTTWQGVIDRLYQEPNGAWILEDFKTDDLPDEALPQRARAYHRQLALYREAIRLARPNLEPEVRIAFLVHGVILNLSPRELEFALRDV
jgi:ATP-dependent exoDNAse (exonuclease V) beta subunit